MKKTYLLTSLLLVASFGFSQQWTLDKSHSNVGFTVTHLLINDVDGVFKDFDATLTSAKEDFSDAAVSFTAQVASVHTGNDKRDEHIKQPDFFDAAKYPTISFKSTSIKKLSDKKYALTGNLTMHGITKPVTLDVQYRGSAVSPMSKKTVVAFKITSSIKRDDFKISEKTPNAILSDQVDINANVEFVKN